MARVLITGCSTGIGRAAAVELTKRGFEVVATARRPETLEDLDVADKLRLDVDDDASVKEAVAKAGQIDALVNNAGWGMHSPIEKTPLDEVRRMFETNVIGAVRTMQAVLPQMRERGSGVIVNVSSLAGLVSSPLGGFYSATKHALEAITEALHYEAGLSASASHSSNPVGSRRRSTPTARSTGSTNRRTTSWTRSGKRRKRG